MRAVANPHAVTCGSDAGACADNEGAAPTGQTRPYALNRYGGLLIGLVLKHLAWASIWGNGGKVPNQGVDGVFLV